MPELDSAAASSAALLLEARTSLRCLGAASAVCGLLGGRFLIGIINDSHDNI